MRNKEWFNMSKLHNISLDRVQTSCQQNNKCQSVDQMQSKFQIVYVVSSLTRQAVALHTGWNLYFYHLISYTVYYTYKYQDHVQSSHCGCGAGRGGVSINIIFDCICQYQHKFTKAKFEVTIGNVAWLPFQNGLWTEVGGDR